MLLPETSTAIQPRTQTVSALLSNRAHDNTTLDTIHSHDHTTAPSVNPCHVDSLSRARTP